MGAKTKEKLETEITLTSGDKSVSMSGEQLEELKDKVDSSRNPHCFSLQLAMFDGYGVDDIVFVIKGCELETHDFDGPVKMGKIFTATVKVCVTEIKVTRDKGGNFIRKHGLQIFEMRSYES